MLVLLDVEKQVPALAHRIEIARMRHRLARRAFRKRQDVLPAAPDILVRRSVTALRDEGAGRIDLAARETAVQADRHDSARLEQRQQNAPARHRIREVMQNAAPPDEVEGAAE